MTPRSLVLAVLLAALSAAAQAELGDCPSIGRGPDYKVVLGGVSVAPAAGTSEAAVRQRLVAKLRTSEEALSLDNERRRLATAECPNRIPRDRTEFDRRTVTDLNDLNVVLEIWGAVAPSPIDAQRQEARIEFALISLLRFEPAATAFFEVAFPRRGSDALGELLLAEPTELRALTALAVARRLHEDGRYDAAKRAYCEAHSHLGAVSVAVPQEQAAWTALRQLALTGAGKVIADARADADYHGGLRLLQPGQPACAGAAP